MEKRGLFEESDRMCLALVQHKSENYKIPTSLVKYAGKIYKSHSTDVAASLFRYFISDIK